MRDCQRLAASSDGVSRCSAAATIFFMTRAKFFRNWGLSSSQLAIQKLSDFGLDGPGGIELSLDELPLDRLTLKGVIKARFGFHERGDSAPESGILLSISSKMCQVSFQAAFFLTPPAQIALNGLVQQLIDGAAFDFTEALERNTFFGVNSQSERDSSHANSLCIPKNDVNTLF
jgi:hypothetical protein